MGVVNRDGYIVDENGVVVEEQAIDYGPEWRVYEPDEVRRSRGRRINVLYHDYDVGSDIDVRHGVRDYVRYLKLMAINRRLRIQGWRQRNMVRSLYELRRLCGTLGVREIICHEAARIIHKIGGTRLDPEYVAKTALVVASALHGEPPPVRINMPISVLMEKGVFIRRRVNETVLREIERLASKLGIRPRDTMFAVRLFMLYRDKLLGRQSRSIAATLLYITAKLLGYNIIQKEVARAAGITETTMRNVMRAMGLRVRYIVEDGRARQVYEWYPGIDSYGLRSVQDILAMFNINASKVSSNVSMGRDRIVVNIVVEGGEDGEADS